MGLLTEWLLDRSRANRAKQDKLNETQAQVYLEAIKSGRLAGNPEALDYANQQVEKLLGTKGKGQKGGAGGPSDSKSLFQRFGQIVHALHGHGQQPQGQQQMGSVGPPPSAGPVEGDETAPTAKTATSPIPPPPSFSSIASQAFPSPATKESEYETQKSFDVGQDIRKEQAKAEAEKNAKIAEEQNKPTPPPKASAAPKVNYDQGVPVSISRDGKTLVAGSPEMTDDDKALFKSANDAYEKGQKDKAALSAKRQSYFGSLPQGVLLKRPVSASDARAMGMKGVTHDLQAGELGFAPRDVAAQHGDLFANPPQGDQALQANARTGEIQQTVDFLNDAIDKLPDTAWDNESLAQVAYVLRSPDPRSAMDTFFKSEASKSLSEAQMNYITALVSMTESAQAMTSIQGIGQRGSDKLRATISAMLPSGATPTRAWAQRQMKLFQAELSQLRKGIPSLGGLTGGGNFKSNPPPTAPGAPPRDAPGYLEYLRNKKAANASNTTAP
jgi:hypothetical protein